MHLSLSLYRDDKFDVETRKPEIVRFDNTTKGRVDSMDQMVSLTNTNQEKNNQIHASAALSQHLRSCIHSSACLLQNTPYTQIQNTSSLRTSTSSSYSSATKKMQPMPQVKERYQIIKRRPSLNKKNRTLFDLPPQKKTPTA
ncbi:hypothetical protein PoB_004502700 [Plakobranchus ocellatus]|uniref:Shugoshin C-terminal domain-containing protein n=1 Tax=Plakobranchus ocellatus TaxID=259542 RepID=A0AAV4BGY2_9GAST|nr:hypothetical protein PoB_004502700 [Plakobranchus ocellatus]